MDDVSTIESHFQVEVVIHTFSRGVSWSWMWGSNTVIKSTWSEQKEQENSVWAFYHFLNRQAELPQQELDAEDECWPPSAPNISILLSLLNEGENSDVYRNNRAALWYKHEIIDILELLPAVRVKLRQTCSHSRVGTDPSYEKQLTSCVVRHIKQERERGS